MAEQMDVDSDVHTDNTFLNDHGQGMLRARDPHAMFKEENLIEFAQSQQDGFVRVTHNGLDDPSTKESATSKQRTALPQSLVNVLNWLSGQRGSQRGGYSMNAEDLRACLEDSRAQIAALENAYQILQKDKLQDEMRIEQLQARVESTRQDNDKLCQEREDAVEEKETLSSYIKAMEKDHDAEIMRLNNEIRNLTCKSDKLRQMIVPVSEKQVLDSEVVFKFTSLCSSILGLVRQTWKTELKDDYIGLKRMSTFQREFFGSDYPLTYNRLRSLVFYHIHLLILNSKSYFLGHSFEKLEHHLQMVEEDLTKALPQENGKQIMEWRNATLQATETLRDNGRYLSSVTQDVIWKSLSPVKTKDAAAEQNGRKKLKTICDNAVEFSLMIRQLKDDFRVDILDAAVGKPISKWDKGVEEIESLAVENGIKPGTIAYVITGVLVKSPKDLKKTLVLEKGEVSVYN